MAGGTRRARWWATVAHDDDATRLQLGGVIDYYARDEVIDLVANAFEKRLADDVVIDLREVASMDATGFQAAVVVPAAKAHGAGVELHVVANDAARERINDAGLSYLID